MGAKERIRLKLVQIIIKRVGVTELLTAIQNTGTSKKQTLNAVHNVKEELKKTAQAEVPLFIRCGR